MSENRPVGSGYFAATWGGLFLLAAIASLSDSVVHWARGLSPLAILRGWCVCAGVVLIAWGVGRITSAKADQDNKTVGQDTINFVVAILAATFALAALFHG
jgi:hypothetical protein